MAQRARTLQRGLEVLLALARVQPPQPLELDELRETLGFNRSTLYRYLSTLESMGFVERGPDGEGYRVGPAVLDLTAAFLAGKKLVTEADAPMQELARKVNETVYLATLDGDSMLYLHMKEPPFPHTQMAGRVGSRRPAYCSSLGKAFLAFLPEEVVDEVLAHGMPARTPKTLTTPEALKEDLEIVRRRGYALDVGEQQLHVRCAGAPVFGHSNRVIASISVAGTTETLADERLHEVGMEVRKTARRISRRMGALFHPFQTLGEEAR